MFNRSTMIQDEKMILGFFQFCPIHFRSIGALRLIEAKIKTFEVSKTQEVWLVVASSEV